MNTDGIWIGLLFGLLVIGLIEAIKRVRHCNRELKDLDNPGVNSVRSGR